jgi:hypothetical protein
MTLLALAPNWLGDVVMALPAMADALTEFGHPEGPRLQKEAKAYFDGTAR